MSPSTYVNTAFKAAYGVEASNGTMGILREGTKVLIIHRRLKDKNIQKNGPPGQYRGSLPLLK
jgi:hypothetical protein